MPRLRERQREIERLSARQARADVRRLERRDDEPIIGDRWHDIDVAACGEILSDADRARLDSHHRVLAHYDRQISPYRVPSVQLSDYHDLLRAHLPQTICL